MDDDDWDDFDFVREHSPFVTEIVKAVKLGDLAECGFVIDSYRQEFRDAIEAGERQAIAILARGRPVA